MFNFKKSILYLALLTVICWVLFTCVSCNSKKNSSSLSGKPKHRDTIGSMFLVRPPGMGPTEGVWGKMVIVDDTLTWKYIGNGLKEEKGGPDTFYLATFPMTLVDSLNNPMKDSAGKLKTVLSELPFDKKWVRSGYVYLDSMIKELNELR